MRKSLVWLVFLAALTLMALAAPVGAQEPPPSAGEVIVADGIHHSAPPTFTADPFAADFVITGTEFGPLGQHYLPSNGDGTFAARSDIPGLLAVDGMDVADMDRDGDNDALICDSGTGEVYLYTNDGSGIFPTSVVATDVTSGAPGLTFCTYLRVGDFNQDGRKDFVVGDNRVTKGMFVYLQASPGSFTKVTPGLDIATWSTEGGNAIFGVAVGDVDGDRHQDILVLGHQGIGAGQVRFYKGDGTGAMAPSTVLFNIGTDFGVAGSVGLALFDLEGDGDLDIIAGGGADGALYVYTNDGTGNFTKPTDLALDFDDETGIDAFDFDQDGDHDLVVVAFFGKSLFYVENLGGTLASPVLVSSLDESGIGVGAPMIAEVPASVGGATTFLGNRSDPADGGVAMLAGSVIGVFAMLTAGGWYARRRWLGSRS